MRLTLLFKSDKSRLVVKLSRNKMIALLVIVSGLFLVSSRDTYQLDEDILRIQSTQSGLTHQAQELQTLKGHTEQKLTGMLIKLSDLQSQIQRLDALGSRLVEQANLNPEEFNFGHQPSIGGPINVSDVEVNVQDEILVKMDNLLAQIKDKSKQLNALESILLSHHITEESRLEGKPIEKGWLSSYYGIRKDPFSGMPAMHKGLDFAGKEGEPVKATGAGIVTWAGARYGYGELVEIDHGQGLTTRYGHNKELNVKIGDVVTKGQAIAVMGNTGRSTGAHVHYEVLRKGKQLDPLPYVYR